MAELTWDAPTERYYETGTDHGVIYKQKDDGTYDTGVAVSGLTGVELSPSGAEPTRLWADNINYLNILSAEQFDYTIKGYKMPPEFLECDGYAEVIPGVCVGQQMRRSFGFSFRSNIGNDIKDNKYGYKIHIIYSSTAKPTSRSYATINDSPEAMEVSYECTATPQICKDFDPFAHVEIDSTKIAPAKLTTLIEKLYGTATTEPTLPTPTELVALLQ